MVPENYIGYCCVWRLEKMSFSEIRWSNQKFKALLDK
jgi:hypothetical protein